MIYPPRPKNQIKADSMKLFDNGAYIAQPKLNGSNCVIVIESESVSFFNRHKEKFAYPPQIDFSPLSLTGRTILNGEFLNKNQEPLNNAIVIFDILEWNGKSLIGCTTEERLKRLDMYFGPQQKGEYITPLLPAIYRINNFYSDFRTKYDELISIPLIEGFVFKRKTGVLEPGHTENNNSGWQFKCRKPTKNYRI